MTLYPKKRTALWLLFVSTTFVALGIALGKTGDVLGWFCVAFFGLGVLVAHVNRVDLGYDASRSHIRDMLGAVREGKRCTVVLAREKRPDEAERTRSRHEYHDKTEDHRHGAAEYQPPFIVDLLAELDVANDLENPMDNCPGADEQDQHEQRAR